jgi:hypothetical protein
MRHLYAALAMATVVVLMGHSQSARAGTSGVDKPEYCLAAVDGPVPLEASAGKAERYAMVIRTLTGKPGNVTGTLALYTATQRYDVPVVNVTAFSDQDRRTHPTVILVRFPEPLRIERARLASLAGDDGGPCAPATAMTQWKDVNVITKAALSRIAEATPISAGAPISDPAPACAGDDRIAWATSPVTPRWAPDGGAPPTGATEAEVFLADDGYIVNAVVSLSSGSRSFDGATLDAARASKYTPAIDNCYQHGGVYLFRAQYRTQYSDLNDREGAV